MEKQPEKKRNDGRTTRRDFLRLSMLSGGALVLAACGAAPAAQPTSAPAEQPTSAPAAQPTAAPTAAPAPTEPPKPKVLTWALTGDPVTVEPYGINTTGQGNYEARELSYDSLLFWDKDLVVQPGLATSVETPDDLTYVFTLRQGVKFHNGKELTSEDVKFSLDTIMTPPGPDAKNPGAGFFARITEIVADAPDKVTVKTKEIDPTIPGLFAWSRFTSTFPKELADEVNPAVEMIGTGPFKLLSYTQNSELVYEKYADHWNPEQPGVDSFTYRVLPEEDARIAALRAGEIDGADVSALGARRLEGDAELTIIKGLFSQPKVIQMTLKGGKPWDDKRVRQAISLTIDRQEVIDKVMEGEAELTGPVPPGYGPFPLPAAELAERYKVDVEKAKALMAEAGYADGFTVVAQAFTEGGGYSQANAQVVQEQLKQINIDMQIETVEFGTFAQNNSKGEFEWHFTGRGMRHDVTGYMNEYRKLGAVAPIWFEKWESPEINALYDQLITTLDQTARVSIAQDLQRLVLDECMHISLYQDYRFTAVRKRVEGYYVAFTTFRPALRTVTVTD